VLTRKSSKYETRWLSVIAIDVIGQRFCEILFGGGISIIPRSAFATEAEFWDFIARVRTLKNDPAGAPSQRGFEVVAPGAANTARREER
jgi:hypothetical protein